MQLKRALGCASALVQSRLGRRIPLIVSWRLVHRCNLRCQYCDIPNVPTGELDTNQVLTVLDDLARAGTTYLNFTGGEVLLREDLGTILRHTADLGITHSVNTNGALVPRRMEALRRVSVLTLSLDGEEDVHDAARGAGTHRQVMAALQAARAAGLKVVFTTVLSSRNLASVPWLLAIAAREQVGITFQPARLEKLGSGLSDPITPDPTAYQEAIGQLLQAKRRGNRWILSSETTLEHLASFPAPRSIPCQAGRLYFRIEANGDLLACTDTRRPEVLANVVRDGLEKALAQTQGGGCSECWGASRVEFNLAAGFRPEPILNIVRTR